MKSILICLLVVAGIITSSKTYAVTSASALKSAEPSIRDLTVKDFIALDIHKYQSISNKQLTWMQKTLIKTFQKKLARKIARGKLDPTTTLKEVTETDGNKRGLLSVVFAVAGLLFLFIPGWVGYLGILLSAVGLYFGIKGMQKDEDTLLALIGTIVGALVLLLNVIILI